jgi:hypothetical protein
MTTGGRFAPSEPCLTPFGKTPQRAHFVRALTQARQFARVAAVAATRSECLPSPVRWRWLAVARHAIAAAFSGELATETVTVSVRAVLVD